MASPTQTVVGRGTPNPLILEGLLKNPKGTCSPPLLQNLQLVLTHRMVGPQKYLRSFL